MSGRWLAPSGDPDLHVELWGLLSTDGVVLVEVDCGRCGELVSEHPVRPAGEDHVQLVGRVDVARWMEHLSECVAGTEVGP